MTIYVYTGKVAAIAAVTLEVLMSPTPAGQARTSRYYGNRTSFHLIHRIACYTYSIYIVIMIVSFRDHATADILRGKHSKANSAAEASWGVARKKLQLSNAAVTLEDLRLPPGNQLKPLKRARSGQHSIRVNDQYRICFVWTEYGPDMVEFTDYHDEK